MWAPLGNTDHQWAGRCNFQPGLSLAGQLARKSSAALFPVRHRLRWRSVRDQCVPGLLSGASSVSSAAPWPARYSAGKTPDEKTHETETFQRKTTTTKASHLQSHSVYCCACCTRTSSAVQQYTAAGTDVPVPHRLTGAWLPDSKHCCCRCCSSCQALSSAVWQCLLQWPRLTPGTTTGSGRHLQLVL